jgi:hypothetical protein
MHRAENSLAMRRFLHLSLLLCSASAFAGTGHIYNLSDGGITVVKYSRWHGDHGPATATMPSGEKLKGEYSVTRGGSASWGSIYASVYGPEGATTATGNGSRLAVSIRGQGTLILTGDQGTIMNCEFISSGHGSGACVDNHEVKYKLLF